MPRRKTKIICTIGPATSSYEMLEKLAHAGMNVARLNMSHGDHQSHAEVIKRLQTDHVDIIHIHNLSRNFPCFQQG